MFSASLRQGITTETSGSLVATAVAAGDSSRLVVAIFWTRNARQLAELRVARRLGRSPSG